MGYLPRTEGLVLEGDPPFERGRALFHGAGLVVADGELGKLGYQMAVILQDGKGLAGLLA